MTNLIIMARSFHFLAVLMLWDCLIGYMSADINTDQSSLVVLKSRITSDPHNIITNNWTTANGANSVCSWTGVSCSVRHLRVTALDLSGMDLGGSIPAEIGNLTFLVYLNMSSNFFNGNLPKELPTLHRLRVIDLSSNNIQGELPSSWSSARLEIFRLHGNALRGMIPEVIGKLPLLKDLRLHNNMLTGAVPATLFNVSSLQLVNLRNNSLSGSLPADMCSRLINLRGLNLARNKLNGEIPLDLSRCSQLRSLSLSYNSFSGPVPREIGNLTALVELFLGFNSLSGEIPQEFSHLYNLGVLGMENNNLTGFLPWMIFNISSLRYLSFAYNNLTGSLPREIGNSTMLRTIYLSYNNLTGVIPQEIGNLYELEELALAANSLTGSIPLGMFNMSKLRGMSLDRNRLSGDVPVTQSINLPSLEHLHLNGNDLKGQILNYITNCSKLITLELGFSQFSGPIPMSLSKLSQLRILNLNGNRFTSDSSPGELSFLTSLTNCRHLERLYLSNNPLNGILPSTIGNFSDSLSYILADNCKIKGNIPSEVGNLSGLETFSIINNDLTGTIPPAIRGLPNLQRLFLGDNQLTGSIPYSLCTCQNLGSLDIERNQISGPIPACLGDIAQLRELYLSLNKLDSSIPENLWNREDLLRLDLSSNSLTGSLSPNISKLNQAIYIDLSENVLSGTIPSAIGSLQSLKGISLARNHFHGSIPESMGSMLSLEQLDLSQNNLSGVIPKSLETLKYLVDFNVSFNELSGEIPSNGSFRNFTYQSFMYNEDLCGASRFNVKPCRVKPADSSNMKRKLLIIFVSLGCAVVIVTAAVILVLMKHRKKKQNLGGSGLLSPLRERRFSHYELQQATDGYSENNLLGVGGYGAVYKGILRDGTVLAVKVFNLQVEGAMKSFDVECEVLRNLRHRNLTKVISSCTNNSFKALVLEYMPKGNLESWLYAHDYFLDFMQRIDIMIGVASAMEYLHHGCSTPVIHCDLKPSNVLLDEDMVAHVSDFGLAKMLAGEDSITHTRTLATMGYMAPEYGMGGTISPKCDVYSYGIMLMEVFTKTKPYDEGFIEGLTMRSKVYDSLQNVHLIVDPNLLDANEQHYVAKLDCLNSIMELAINCSEESPRERASMKDVLTKLKKIKLQLLTYVGENI